MNTNTQIVKDAGAITTGSVTHGLLQPYQAKRFLRQTFEATPLQGLIRHELRREKTGEIDKIGIANRIIRAKKEGTDDGYRAKPNYGVVEYACKAYRLPWEITEETLLENIEGQSFEQTVEQLMTTQLGVDTEDLSINGDESVVTTDPDYDFLKLNDGYVKQILNGGHVYDAGSLHSGQLILDTFYGATQTMPNKYRKRGTLRWLMSPTRAEQWENYLLNKVINAGGVVPDNVYTAPARIPVVEVPALSDDKVILCDPKNLIQVNTYTVKIRKTTEGKSAVMQDKRFYVIHFDADFIIEELDATAIITGLV